MPEPRPVQSAITLRLCRAYCDMNGIAVPGRKMLMMALRRPKLLSRMIFQIHTTPTIGTMLGT